MPPKIKVTCDLPRYFKIAKLKLTPREEFREHLLGGVGTKEDSFIFFPKTILMIE